MTQSARPPLNDPAVKGEPLAPEKGRSLWADARRKIFRDWTAMVCLTIVGVYALLAVGGVVYGIVAEHNPDVPAWVEIEDYDNARQAPSLGSWRTILGTDWRGRSILLKTILGAKVSMAVGLISNLIAVPLGMLLGAVAGYYGGKTDSLIVWLFSTLASIPGIILLIAIKYAFKGVEVAGLDLGGIYGMFIGLGIISWIGVCRLVRAETLKLRELDYVLAARAGGRGGMSILLRHILPNVMHIGIIRFSLGFVGAVQAEVILSYLNLGVGPGVPSWGRMLNAAQQELIAGRWNELAAAVGAIFLLVLSLNIFGDRLRDALDPRLRTT